MRCAISSCCCDVHALRQGYSRRSIQPVVAELHYRSSSCGKRTISSRSTIDYTDDRSVNFQSSYGGAVEITDRTTTPHLRAADGRFRFGEQVLLRAKSLMEHGVVRRVLVCFFLEEEHVDQAPVERVAFDVRVDDDVDESVDSTSLQVCLLSTCTCFIASCFCFFRNRGGAATSRRYP